MSQTKRIWFKVPKKAITSVAIDHFVEQYEVDGWRFKGLDRDDADRLLSYWVEREVEDGQPQDPDA